MTARTAGKDGNWSDVTVWDGGSTLPGSGDTADSNGYTVTIDQNVDLSPSGALIGSNAGAGGFAVSGAYTITADITASVRTVLSCSNGSGVTVTVVGTVTGGASNSQAVNHNGAGTINITGNLTGGSANFGVAVKNSSTGTINITGNVTGGSAANTVGANNSLTGTINITGTVTGGSAGIGVYNNSTGTIAITGTAIAAQMAGAHNQGAGTLTATRAKSGGVSPAVIGIASGGTTWVKELEFAVGTGFVGPIGGYCKVNPDSTANLVSVIRSDNGAALVMSWDYPAEEDVETGVDYALGTLTGTLAGGGGEAHLDSEVLDTATTPGTYHAPDAAEVIDTANFGVNSGETGTVVQASVGDVKDGVTYGPSSGLTGTYDPMSAAVFPAEANTLEAESAYGPTGAEYAGTYHPPDAAEVIDTANFGPSSGTAGTYDTTGDPATPAEIAAVVAPAVWALARTGNDAAGSFGAVTEWASTGGLDAAGVRTAVGLAAANLDTQLAPLADLAEDTEIAAAVRTELATELARIDAAITSRLASAGYTAPDNAGITDIKAQTDLLPAAPAAVGDIPTTGQITAALLAMTYEGAETWQAYLRLTRAVLLGKSANGGADYRDLADTKNRVDATLDVNGNRTAVTVDAT